MSLIPELEIGLWNAWVFTVILYAAVFAPLAINGERVEKRMAGEPSGDEQAKVTRTVAIITHAVIMPFTMIISIFIPIEVGT